MYGGNLGYIDADEDGHSSATVLADIVNRCLRLVDTMLYGADFSETMTLTFGEQSVGHTGMEISGSGLLPEGLSMQDLRQAQRKFHSIGVVTELIELNDILPEAIGAQEAGILIVRGGIQALFDQWCEINDRERGVCQFRVSIGNNNASNGTVRPRCEGRLKTSKQDTISSMGTLT